MLNIAIIFYISILSVFQIIEINMSEKVFVRSFYLNKNGYSGQYVDIVGFGHSQVYVSIVKDTDLEIIPIGLEEIVWSAIGKKRLEFSQSEPKVICTSFTKNLEKRIQFSSNEVCLFITKNNKLEAQTNFKTYIPEIKAENIVFCSYVRGKLLKCIPYTELKNISANDTDKIIELHNCLVKDSENFFLDI